MLYYSHWKVQPWNQLSMLRLAKKVAQESDPDLGLEYYDKVKYLLFVDNVEIDKKQMGAGVYKRKYRIQNPEPEVRMECHCLCCRLSCHKMLQHRR